ncbi:MAG: bifunctional proline dehydrogenase/L-glutamate gamma-semialdehyde dehydrogenase PutA, partial [Hyphomicrobium sp.]
SKPCRIYAPVGDHEYLLSYLVRRLLENGSNTSFVNRLADDETPISRIIQDPLVEAENELVAGDHKKNLSKPRDLFWPDRRNSKGLALDNSLERSLLLEEMRNSLSSFYKAGPILSGRLKLDEQQARVIHCPHNLNEKVGSVRTTQLKEIDLALNAASKAVNSWGQLGGVRRAKILDTASDFIERDRSKLMALLVREGGKTIPNALSEVREAVDFLRYYAFQARRLFAEPISFKGPTGETNTMSLNGRGVFLCISPWNFPLGIYIGQIAAALAAGNTVVAKPAEQTPLIAFLATRLLHEAGVPPDVLHFVPGGSETGAALVQDKRIQGIAFTGSNETAWAIQKVISERRSAIIPFIAETGGINAMIADSSALPEQVVRDVVRSAFDSVGQRCSSARVLFLQNEIANKTIEMITGAVSCLQIGDPFLLSTDIGPVIDDVSQKALESHKLRMKLSARELIDTTLPLSCQLGTYVAPACYEIERFDILDREVFGPVLHIIRYPRGRLEDVISSINASGFGLTLGLHSRIQAVADYVTQNVRVGNFYINRSQVGAIPGVQPFGGEGLSGTGPKAGGPNYIQRFATERVCSTDITATGGNIQLLTLSMNDETNLS